MSSNARPFEVDEPFIEELLGEVQTGALQLPDFQRGWVWEDERIRALLASLSLSYPIGAAMFMKVDGGVAGFAPRLFEGVDPGGCTSRPKRLVLDGQQRLTSIFRALRGSTPVDTWTPKRDPIRRWYYFDMKKCLDAEVDRVDAIFGVPEDRTVRSDFNRKVDLDLSTAHHEYELACVPALALLDNTRWFGWRSGYSVHHQYNPVHMKFLDQFDGEVRQRFLQYKVPVIVLDDETPKEAVCQVFENVNTGGVALTVFELLTATYATAGFRLRDDWASRKKRLDDLDVLQDVSETDFLQAVTLLSTFEHARDGQGAVGAKRKDILRLSLEDYKHCADLVEAGMRRAARLLVRERVFVTRNIPYQSQLIPLSVLCSIFGEQADEDRVKRKLAQWYWCGVFGELYGGATEARFAQDVQQVPAWIDGGPAPRTVVDASFAPTRLLSMQSRLSAAYKGIMAILMGLGSLDLRTGDAVALAETMEDSLDIHHIFPAKYCEEREPRLPREQWNSVVNKTPLAAKTNRMIGKQAPSVYLTAFDKRLASVERVDELLRSHAADPEALRTDNFELFLRRRAARLLDLIEKATGKVVAGRDSEETQRAFGGSLVSEER